VNLIIQLSRFSSWKPDSEAEFVNAFSKSWSDLFYYLFPPFSLVSRCLQKIQRDRTEVMILEALSEIPSFSKFFLTIDMQLDLTDCEEDVFFPFLEFSLSFCCVCVKRIG
jgi:hypothetical protein